MNRAHSCKSYLEVFLELPPQRFYVDLLGFEMIPFSETVPVMKARLAPASWS